MTTAGDGALTSRDLDRSSLRPGDLERPLERPSSTRRDILHKDELYLIQLSVLLAKSDDLLSFVFFLRREAILSSGEAGQIRRPG